MRLDRNPFHDACQRYHREINEIAARYIDSGMSPGEAMIAAQDAIKFRRQFAGYFQNQNANTEEASR